MAKMSKLRFALFFVTLCGCASIPMEEFRSVKTYGPAMVLPGYELEQQKCLANGECETFFRRTIVAPSDVAKHRKHWSQQWYSYSYPPLPPNESLMINATPPCEIAAVRAAQDEGLVIYSTCRKPN